MLFTPPHHDDVANKCVLRLSLQLLQPVGHAPKRFFRLVKCISEGFVLMQLLFADSCQVVGSLNPRTQRSAVAPAQAACVLQVCGRPSRYMQHSARNNAGPSLATPRPCRSQQSLKQMPVRGFVCCVRRWCHKVRPGALRCAPPAASRHANAAEARAPLRRFKALDDFFFCMQLEHWDSSRTGQCTSGCCCSPPWLRWPPSQITLTRGSRSTCRSGTRVPQWGISCVEYRILPGRGDLPPLALLSR